MPTNKFYFDYSASHPEPIFDPYYARDKLIIPPCADEDNPLTANHRRLIDLITAFEVDLSLGKDRDDQHITQLLAEIEDILQHTKNINLSPFCQFFMVQNSSYDAYKSIPRAERPDFLYEMLVRYCSERHNIYKSHGYTNTALQVVCDSYSHKRKCRTSITKFEDLLKPYGVTMLQNAAGIISSDDYYFLPDKTGRRPFDAMLSLLEIQMKSRAIEQDKYPDIVFKHNAHYYIFELKSMKGSGGGQNKQAVEFAYFIKFSENNPNIHYCIMLDSLYANDLFVSHQPKIAAQRRDVLAALANNPQNFFVNTAGAKRLLQDIFTA